MPNTYTVNVNSSTTVSPMTQQIATGPVTIVWVPASGVSWGPSGVQISQTNSVGSGGTGTPTWGGGAPTSSGGNYQVSFNNVMTGSYVFTYTVDVTTSSNERPSSSNNPPVIQNEGGPWPPYDPDRD